MGAMASLERRKYSLSELLDRANGGGLRAPMLRNTYGLWPERRYRAGAWAAYWL